MFETLKNLRAEYNRQKADNNLKKFDKNKKKAKSGKKKADNIGEKMIRKRKKLILKMDEGIILKLTGSPVLTWAQLRTIPSCFCYTIQKKTRQA